MLIVVQLNNCSNLNVVIIIKYTLEPNFRSLASRILFENFQRIRACIIIVNETVYLKSYTLRSADRIL